MEAARSLQTFHEFPGSAAPWLAQWRQLWAGTDGRARYRLWPCVRFVLGQTYARAGTAPANARHAFDFRNVRVGRRRGEPLRRIRHKVWRAGGREDVHFFACIALGHGLGIRWMRGDCDDWGDGYRDSESTGKNQTSSRTRVSRHCQDSTNAERSLQTFSAFAGNVSAAHTKKAGAHRGAPASLSGLLRARADLRVWHRLRTLGLLLFGKADALAGIASGARNVVDLWQAAWRGDANLRRIRHQIRRALTGEGVLGFASGARRDRRRSVGWHGDDGDRRRGRNSDCEPAGKEQSYWKLQGRHRHAFCRFTDCSSPEVVAAEGIC
jgi:hypothetical protein